MNSCKRRRKVERPLAGRTEAAMSEAMSTLVNWREDGIAIGCRSLSHQVERPKDSVHVSTTQPETEVNLTDEGGKGVGGWGGDKTRQSKT